MDPRYARTPMGQAEIQSRALGLSRPVRNLLLVINPSQTGAEWLAQVRGVTPDDLARLLAEGLVAPVTSVAPGAAPAPPAPPAPPPAGAPPSAPTWPSGSVPASTAPASPAGGALPVDDLARALEALLQCTASARYSSLYDALTGQAKARLGLMKGYRLVLDVEKADGVTGLRALARQVGTDWARTHGLEAVRELHRAIATREAAALPPPAAAG
jgi:hypothetical protein